MLLKTWSWIYSMLCLTRRQDNRHRPSRQQPFRSDNALSVSRSKSSTILILIIQIVLLNNVRKPHEAGACYVKYSDTSLLQVANSSHSWRVNDVFISVKVPRRIDLYNSCQENWATARLVEISPNAGSKHQVAISRSSRRKLHLPLFSLKMYLFLSVIFVTCPTRWMALRRPWIFQSLSSENGYFYIPDIIGQDMQFNMLYIHIFL